MQASVRSLPSRPNSIKDCESCLDVEVVSLFRCDDDDEHQVRIGGEELVPDPFVQFAPASDL